MQFINTKKRKEKQVLLTFFFKKWKVDFFLKRNKNVFKRKIRTKNEKHCVGELKERRDNKMCNENMK